MEWCRSECGKYKIECLTASTIPGALKVMQESYFRDGIGATATGVKENSEAVEELLDLCADAALDGVSLVAVEITTGEVAAVAFNKLQVAMNESAEKPFLDTFAEERCTQESTKAFLQYMRKVNSLCDVFQIYGVECSMKIWVLSTLAEHRNKNLGFLLCKSSLDLARKLKDGPVSHITVADLGPKYAHIKPRSVTTKIPEICHCFASSLRTQNISKALGLTSHIRVPFTEFFYKGKNYTETVGSNPHSEAFVCRLN